MLERISSYESELFLFLNSFHNNFLDSFMWFVSGRIEWVAFVLFMIYILIKKTSWKESLLIILTIVLLATTCDQFTSSFCKPFFERLRPTHDPFFMDKVQIVNGYRGALYGFMSSHATNSFGFAVFSSLLFRHKFFTSSVFLWAILVSYSRIYLGVHFISDIVAGIIIGSIFGYLYYLLYSRIGRRYLIKNSKVEMPYLLYSDSVKYTLAFALLLNISVLLFVSVFA